MNHTLSKVVICLCEANVGIVLLDSAIDFIEIGDLILLLNFN
jgi:hypothetical protein